MSLKQNLVDRAIEPLIPVIEASTDLVEPEHRIAYWEAHNAAELVGLTCRELNGAALRARERNYDLGSVRLSDISGSPHEIERNQLMVSRLPKDALFVSVLVDGQGYFLQDGRKVCLQPGDAVLYATDKPYLFGFSKPMRQVLVDLNLKAPQCRGWPRLHGPLCVSQNHPIDRYDMASLLNLLTGFVQQPERSHADCVAMSVQSLVGKALGRSVARTCEATAHLRYLRARAFIAEKATDPGLGRSHIAEFMGVSVRTLERLFGRFNVTVSDVIWAQRFSYASALLIVPDGRFKTIGEVAMRCGFATQAHFSVAFRKFYGVSPRQYREQHCAVNSIN